MQCPEHEESNLQGGKDEDKAGLDGEQWRLLDEEESAPQKDGGFQRATYQEQGGW